MRLLSLFNSFLIRFSLRLAPRKTILANFFCFLLMWLLKANATSLYLPIKEFSVFKGAKIKIIYYFPQPSLSSH